MSNQSVMNQNTNMISSSDHIPSQTGDMITDTRLSGYQPYGSTPESYGTLKKGTPDYTVPAATPEGGGESEPQETRSQEGETFHTKQEPPDGLGPRGGDARGRSACVPHDIWRGRSLAIS